VFVYEKHFACIVCVCVWSPLQWALSSVYLHHYFVLGQAHVSDGTMHIWNHCSEEVVWASGYHTASEKTPTRYPARAEFLRLFPSFSNCKMENSNTYFLRGITEVNWLSVILWKVSWSDTVCTIISWPSCTDFFPRTVFWLYSFFGCTQQSTLKKMEGNVCCFFQFRSTNCRGKYF